jgi:putative oxidoreductase
MTSIAMTSPAAPALRRRIAATLGVLGWFPHALQQLLFRFAVGSVFLKAGLVKVQSWDTTVALFRDEYQVPLFSPDVAAMMASTVELGCSSRDSPRGSRRCRSSACWR